MQRAQLEHLIRASAGITGGRELVVIGSQAILGQFPEAPAELLVSVEADLFSFDDPSAGDLIDGSIGEGSPFHQAFGYYAHGVGQDTAVLPKGWRDRLVALNNQNTGGGTGLCLDAHDLAISKLVAGREKDLKFVSGLLRHGLVTLPTLRERLGQTELASERRAVCQARLNAAVNP